MTDSVVPSTVREAFEISNKYFPTPLQAFQFYDKYSRYDYSKGRRETWVETVDRATSYLKELSENKLSEPEYDRIRKFILEMKATPSMRLLAMAGDAARRNNICIYNCSYQAIDSIDAWVEGLIISMCGCGVGFSVEKKYVNQLPIVKKQVKKIGWTPIHVIEDTTEGWATALKFGLETWYKGEDLSMDYSLIRPAGTPLKVKGGQASGPEPLKNLLDFARETILGAQGRKLTPLECHDIMCAVGQAAVSGGVRRTAMISLFDWDDEEMRNCKNGYDFPQIRWNANNSAVWPEDITDEAIRQQMVEMDAGQRGEPGIFNRAAANALRPDRRSMADFGTNPCGEINLRDGEFCNLSITIARADDTLETLKEKVEVATIIGTIQSMALNFPGLRQKWVDNCSEERLLGVDINGQLDCPLLVNDDGTIMEALKAHAVEINKEYAARLGINQSASVTCVKPSGNSSQLFNCSSGLHARWSPYYIRRVRVGRTSPLFSVLQDAGVPLKPENGSTADNAITWVASFPVRSPEGAITKRGRSAIEQCEYWLKVKKHWTEHNPSVTITYYPDEMEALTDWVVAHKDLIGGMSFLPASEAKYEQMPYEEIDEVTYHEMAKNFPSHIDFSRITIYEQRDTTTAAQEVACVSGACDIDYTPKSTT
jgi:ribonucleoside-triphosphate reductase (thioredoxin)